jgi:hypothetical protein
LDPPRLRVHYHFDTPTFDRELSVGAVRLSERHLFGQQNHEIRGIASGLRWRLPDIDAIKVR